MNTEIQLFESPEFGSVRTITEENGTVLFCGGDVAKALGYAVPRKALFDHCRGVLKRNAPTKGGMQELSFIPEPDVYRLIFRSKLPAAERFEKWVVETVLPTIRRHGAYITPQTLAQITANPDSVALLFHEIEQIQNQIADMEPKAAYYNALVESNLLTNIRQTAKELQLPERLFTYLLVEMGFAYRTPKKLLK